MPSPSDRRYSQSHEWHKLEGDILTVGLTKFAIDELTDITYVELKPPGTSLDAGGEIGEVESVKATSDVYSALAGEIVETNAALDDDPSILNADPYEQGWLVKIKIDDDDPMGNLLDAEAYDQQYPN